jgi:hypothetical protein
MVWPVMNPPPSLTRNRQVARRGQLAMAAEVKLEPGWLIRDVRKASDRLKEWATSRTGLWHTYSQEE